jgi:pimeloyl-ACP methyl ester carboxylesterase
MAQCEPSNIPAGARLVIVLIHGTWNRGAKWTRRGPLFEELQKLLPSTHITQYDWTGINTNVFRLRAVAGLISFVKRIRGVCPEAKIALVAHSHGGNIALNALRRRPQLADYMVCLATPFLYFKSRNLDSLYDSARIAVGFWSSMVLYFLGFIFIENMFTGGDSSILFGILWRFHWVRYLVQPGSHEAWVRWVVFLPLPCRPKRTIQ